MARNPLQELQKTHTIHVVSPGFNCAEHVRYWYNSLRVQSYPFWQAYAIDDASDDNTSEEIFKYQKLDPRVKLIRRNQHYYQLGNWFDIISKLPNEDFVVRLDLDDFLGSKYVFEGIVKENLYRGASVFSLTETPMDSYAQNDYSARHYGQDWEEYFAEDSFGDSLFCFKAKYFKAIPEGYFLNEKDEFIRAAGDIAITYPILYQGWNYFHHLYIPNGLMYDTIRDPKYNDDNLKTEEGKRLQFKLRRDFKARTEKLILNKVLHRES